MSDDFFHDPYVGHGPKRWLDMQPETFDADAKPVQGALFPEPDKCGTPDLFDGGE